MIKVIVAAALLVTSTNILRAQSHLPECGAHITSNYVNCHFIYLSNRRQYVVEFKDNDRPGFGVGQSNDGIIISGMWSNRERNGIGSSYLPNGDEFSGTFVGGKQNGFGSWILANGDLFSGQYIENQPMGPGTIAYGNGDVIVGFWKEEAITGTKIWADGRQYTGEFDLHGNPLVPFFAATRPNLSSMDELSCGAKNIQEEFFRLLLMRMSLNPYIHKAVAKIGPWARMFDGVAGQLLQEGSVSESQMFKHEISNPFPFLSLENTRADERDEIMKRTRCSAQLVGKFGALGTHKTTIQYVVQWVGDEKFDVSVSQW